MTAEELSRLHDEYRQAVEIARNAESDEQRETAGAAVIDLRHQLDAALIEDKQYREDQERAAAIEARAHTARIIAAGAAVETKSTFDTPEMRSFLDKQTNGVTFNIPLEKRTTTVLTSGDTSSYSSYSIPQKWASSIYQFEIAESGVLAAGPKILATASGEQINMPKTLTDPTATAGVEGAAASNSTSYVLATVPLNSYRVEGFLPLSDELLRDSGVDLEAYVMEEAGRALAAKKAAYLGDIDIGSGSSAPAAITVGVTSAVTAASQTAVTLDEVKTLMYSVLPKYRKAGKFIGNSAETLRMALLKDDNGNYMWHPAVAADQPDTMFGKPWYEDAYFDASASGNIPVVFGDVNRAYIVRNIGGIEVSFSRDFLFTQFAVTCRFAEWFDAATIDAIAVKGITLA